MATNDIFRLDGKWVLVTGASGSFGTHFAGVLARAGASIILAGRRVEKLEAVAQVVREAGADAKCVAFEVSNGKSVATAFSEMPLPDVVINNAGVQLPGATHELSDEDWDKVLDANLKGAWLVAREAIARWLEAKRPGNVINVASILALRMQNQFAAYASSKAALLQLTRSLALDYAKFGIRANALVPGYFATDINRDWLASPSGDRMKQRIPFKRTGELNELDGPLLLLASDASSYMSGAALVVDGAHTNNTL
jgi:NAD(P)-dependent dehydrogenase (short-subunit alcohol dehydrogenase family)